MVPCNNVDNIYELGSAVIILRRFMIISNNYLRDCDNALKLRPRCMIMYHGRSKAE